MDYEGEQRHHHHHHGHHHNLPRTREESGVYDEKPTGELVTLFSESNPNYRLAMKPEGVVLAFKNKADPQQHWIKVDMGGKFSDAEGSPGFMLINNDSGMVLKHGDGEGDPVIAELWRPNSVDSSFLWSQGRDLGKGYTAIRLVTNISLNLDADHGDRRHGGIVDGHKLLLHSWLNGENQKWKFEAVQTEPSPTRDNE